MTDAIRKLREEVEAGTAIGWHFSRAFPSEDPYGHCTWHDGIRAYSINSFDAALALMKAVLPGVPVAIHDMSQDYLGGQGWVAKVNWPHAVWQPTFTAAGPFAHEGRADTPARALLLAILKALEAQDG